jgi:hypothetical protein
MADEKKIIIDEDWKSQVQAEKEAAMKASPPGDAGGAAVSDSSPASSAEDVPMPPASFELLLSMLATEALVSLGQIPHPATGTVHIQRNQAKYLIDLIGVIKDKTKGNLTPGEEQLIDTLLHQLRMVFVDTEGQASAAT